MAGNCCSSQQRQQSLWSANIVAGTVTGTMSQSGRKSERASSCLGQQGVWHKELAVSAAATAFITAVAAVVVVVEVPLQVY